MTAYSRLSLYDRQKIEEGLDENLSFRSIAQSINRSPSTVSREVRDNRIAKATSRAKRGKCREQRCCTLTGLCAVCPHPHSVCVECTRIDCRDICSTYIAQVACPTTVASPWVCNGCLKRKYGCKRYSRTLYLAKSADAQASAVRSESRRGFDMTLEEMERAAMMIKEGLSRGLSPYETSIAYAGMLAVSESSVYRLVEAGIGGLANIELERKVGFRPRHHAAKKKSTSHGKERSYKAFCGLVEDRQATAIEMDCVEGRRCDAQVVLTLFHRPSHFQLLFLLSEHTQEQVTSALVYLQSICSKQLWARLFFTTLTDNGGEFCDEDGMDGLFGGKKSDPHLFYCDPRRSDQKGRCEKNHSEIRQLLPKEGNTPFDELDSWDMAVVASHTNSSPRKTLCGLSPIKMFKGMLGEDGEDLLATLGIEEMPLDRLVLKPWILDIEREKRGLPPLNWK